MAKKVTVSLVDDLDGTVPAAETVKFSLDGDQYEIDLTSENAEKMRVDFLPYQIAARRISKGPKARQIIKSNQQETREWCRANGFAVADRGRIPAEAQQAWDKHLASAAV